MTRKLSVDLCGWLSIWCLFWGFFYLLLSHNIDYVSHPLITAVYFTVATLLVSVAYRDLFFAYRSLLRPVLWLVPSLSLGLGLAVYVSFPLLLAPPHTLIVRNPDMFFLYLDLRYLFSKLFEIAFQQVLIFLLILLLMRRDLSLKLVSLLCGLLFGFSHLYLLGRNGLLLGGYFVLFAMVAGWVFPRLIVRYRKGLLYTFALHLLFYVLTGALCWSCPSAFVS